MIFVTIGTMLPFDRLVRVMDDWARRNPSEDVFAQIGTGSYEPAYMRWARLLSPSDFSTCVEGSRVVVAHAGTGSFFLAAQMRKPIVMLPRRASLREHTTDHQVHTAHWLAKKKGVYVAYTDDDIDLAIATASASDGLAVESIEPYAPSDLLQKVRHFLTA